MDDNEFDALLMQAAKDDAETPSIALQQRVLADYDRMSARARRSWLRTAGDWIWPGASPWQPAAALAVSLALGVLVGLLAPFDYPLDNDMQSVAMASDVPNDLSEDAP